MNLVTVAESRLSASRCVHSHFVIVSTFCQLTQLQHFLVDNFPLQTGHMLNKQPKKKVFTAHYGSRLHTDWNQSVIPRFAQTDSSIKLFLASKEQRKQSHKEDINVFRLVKYSRRFCVSAGQPDISSTSNERS